MHNQIQANYFLKETLMILVVAIQFENILYSKF